MTRPPGERPIHGETTDRPWCAWADHEWGARRVVESGRHPALGQYLRYLVRCRRCGRETTETEWLDVLSGRRQS